MFIRSEIAVAFSQPSQIQHKHTHNQDLLLSVFTVAGWVGPSAHRRNPQVFIR